jgi:transcriptional regulator with XRE-family HTH domain
MATGTSLSIPSSPRKNLIEELRDPEYRRAFVAAHAGDSIAFQLKAMRLARDLEQRDIATKLGNPALQPMISRYENPDYGKYSINTLLELAHAFDVALIVHFAPFSELVDWDFRPVAERMTPAPFDEDEGLWGEGNTATTEMILTPEFSPQGQLLEPYDGSSNSVELDAIQTKQAIAGTDDVTITRFAKEAAA